MCISAENEPKSFNSFAHSANELQNYGIFVNLPKKCGFF